MAHSTRDVQDRLVALGWPISADGAYGPQTEAAVLDFQKCFGWWLLTRDGWAGPDTFTALQFALDRGGRCSEHFAFREFASKGNGWIRQDLRHVLALEGYRRLLGDGVTIVNGYRDPAYNRHVGGVPNSQHLYGVASDVPARLHWTAVRDAHLFSGIGYRGADGLVVHVDSRAVLPETNRTGGSVGRPSLWRYA